MSEAADPDSKTEEPTEKKIQDAIEQGNVPQSREMAVFFSIMGICIILYLFIYNSVAVLNSFLAFFIDAPESISLTTGRDAVALLQLVAIGVGGFLLPIVCILMVGGILASVLQNPPRFAPGRLEPKWSRLSLPGGFKRIFGLQGQVEFAKSVAKLLIITIVCTILLNSEQHHVVNAMFSDPSAIPEIVLGLAMRLVSAICVATVALVAADLVWSRFRWRKDLRMTRQEIKDELRQSEGDPLMKARMRSIAQDRSRRRMMSAVPNASLVVTNPTHFAIALRYVPEEGGAPVVLAKGKDLIALAIREIAQKHDIPLIEDKALARSMYDNVEIDRSIPPEFYRAVAQLFHYLYQRNGRHA
ncbi:flagellar biosynthetic protein FlhB [Pseudochelatococcus lubricantis]|uniref:Flagellar biosynthetic protein FlhB n=1 Tax=Pseudochelatococcus lubricantis TaxID=1538102 RepID=A0ABX0UVX7_9HYPH|nr:flagellar biosynthesis protein FlhB [Pseudochelatococcus lubricantis]NIJ57109.1 flagellar biosynthetic protein FlhB [Pseudochelatococcus lubricantis]